MAREPVTRMQLDAYRFGQRRLESALARRDPVLLHEEIRGQRRVVITGLVLAMLALVGAFAYAKLANKPAWERQEIIAAKQSGRMFVVIHRPDRLVPVRNLAAARLVLTAAGRSAGRGGSEGKGEPTVLDDAVLDQAPRTPTAAVSGADGVRLPIGPDLAEVGPWAVCDMAGPSPQTIVVGGASTAAPMPTEQGLLLESPEQDLYLVTDGHRYRMDSVDPLRRAYDLVDVHPRKVSNALLSVIPEGRALGMPVIPNAGAAAPGRLPAVVGDIVRAASATGDRYYLVLGNGVEEVSEPVANLVRTGPGIDRSQPPTLVSTERINAIGRVRLAGLDQFPGIMPKAPAGMDSQTLCWQWGKDGKDGAATIARDAPVPPGQQRTQLAQADGLGPRLDVVSVPTGVPVVVHTVADRGGGLWLVSDTGVGYQVAAGANGNNETATALGIQPDAASPAPEQALRLLPSGPDLDLQSATRTVDVLVNTGDVGAAPPAVRARTPTQR
ncbi:MAG: type VII secretion protein EccB [Actinomycetota bacterium]|nr:type VII secretion protein EccB [Actinomycetota bacterium]